MSNADFQKPNNSSGYANYLSEIRAMFDSLVKGLNGTSDINIPTNAIRWSSSNNRWETYNGSTWGVLSSLYGISVDMVDGKHATSTANNLLVLDASALVPTANLPNIPIAKIPSPLTGKAIDFSGGLNQHTHLDNNSGGGVFPSGVIMPYLGASAPTGWLLCNGSAVSRTTYATLFALIGVTYGVGDGSTTFNLPDFRGRMLIGAGQGPGLTNRALGNSGGAETHTLDATEMPTHSHDILALTSRQDTWNEALNNAGAKVPGEDSGSGSWYAGKINSAGGGGAHNNMQPFGVATWIIKY